MKVAVLIPTLNRLLFVKHIVMYYDSLKSPHPIYIGDSSNTEISKNTLLFLKNIKNVEVNYFHWEELNLEQTLLRLAEKASVKCEFCTFQGDDDYFVPTSLTKCAEFLSKNPDYRTAQGRAAAVVTDSPEPVGNIKSIDEYWGENSLEQSSKMERMIFFHNNYYGLQFSTHRVNEFIIDSQDFSTISDKNIHELTHCYTFAINGKSRFVDCLYLIRVRHPNLFIHAPNNFFELMTRKNWLHDYNKMIDSLSLLLHEDKNLSLIEAKKNISSMMNEVLKKDFVKELANNINDKKNFYVKLKNIIPLNFKNRLNLIKNKLFNKEMCLLMSKHSRFHSDFLPIKNNLTGKRFSNDKK